MKLTWPNGLGKKRERKEPTFPPRATRKNKEKRKSTDQQLQGVNTNLTAMSGSNKNNPLPALDLHQQGSPALGTLLAHVRAPGGQIGISLRIFSLQFASFYFDHSVQSDTSQARGHSTEQLILLNGNVYCDGISWGMMMSTVKWNVLRNETKYYRQQANWKVSGKWGRAYREL